MLRDRLKKHTGLILVSLTLLVGIFTYKTYGLSWDEQDQRHCGMVSYNYLVHGDTTLHQYWGKNYGVGFELPLIVIERVFNLHDSREIYLMRHLASHIFFLFSAWLLFLLIDHLYKNKLLATIGFFMLVLNPNIYGHSFFNTKDVPLLSMYIICFAVAAVAFNRYTWKYFVLLGIACALLINIRIMGALMVACVSLFFLADFMVANGDKKIRRQVLMSFLIFWGTTLLALYISWPYLYNAPVKNLVDAYKNSSNHWHATDLFNGHLIPGKDVTRAYIFVWFSIANPIIYLLAGIFGIVAFAIRFLKTPRLFFIDKRLRNILMYMICFACPILTIIILHSPMYDGWRLMYFIYGPFVLMAVYGLHRLFQTRLKVMAVVIIGAGLFSTAWYMISNYPYEYVYFNRIVANGELEHLRKNWEMDYWGVSYKQAYEYILQKDTSSKIDIAVAHACGEYSLAILKPEDRKRIHIVEENQHPEYFITEYRFHPEDYPYSPSQRVFNITVLNSSIMTVYKVW